MVDISKCEGDGCEIRSDCYRFTAKANEHRQSYMKPPTVGKNCEYYWPVKSKSEYKRLEVLTKTV